MTLCTLRLNIGWMRFALAIVEPVAAVAVVATVLVELFLLPLRLTAADEG